VQLYAAMDYVDYAVQPCAAMRQYVAMCLVLNASTHGSVQLCGSVRQCTVVCVSARGNRMRHDALETLCKHVQQRVSGVSEIAYRGGGAASHTKTPPPPGSNLRNS
jgi:hypothetical protein